MGKKKFFKGPVRREPEPYRVNEKIDAREVRVIDEEGRHLGIMDINSALQLAYSKELDLVEIAPNQNPPVCKIVDYGKFKYEMKKKEKKEKKTSGGEVKEISFRPTTSMHDIEIKLKKIKEFIEDGNKVKIRIFFKGRERMMFEKGKEIFYKIFEKMSEWAEVEKEPAPLGLNQYIAIIRKKK
ncbi:MAG: translation initiation factor IF-3 [candidate division WOR-3 bacterium]